MKKILIRMGILSILTLTAAFLSGAVAEAADTAYRPVVFAYLWEGSEGPGALLIGGFRDGTWYRHIDLPILVNGRAITPEEGIQLSDAVPCTTALLAVGENLAFYSPNGKLAGVATVEGTKYSCSAASTESFIDVETDATIPAQTLCIGVADGWDALPSPTRRATGDDRIIFDTGADSTKTTATFLPAVDEYGGAIYRGTIEYAGKSWPLTDADAETKDSIDGIFIDLNGDGRMEFVMYSRTIAGFVAAWDLTQEGPKETLILDLGD